MTLLHQPKYKQLPWMGSLPDNFKKKSHNLKKNRKLGYCNIPSTCNIILFIRIWPLSCLYQSRRPCSESESCSCLLDKILKTVLYLEQNSSSIYNPLFILCLINCNIFGVLVFGGFFQYKNTNMNWLKNYKLIPKNQKKPKKSHTVGLLFHVFHVPESHNKNVHSQWENGVHDWHLIWADEVWSTVYI